MYARLNSLIAFSRASSSCLAPVSSDARNSLAPSTNCSRVLRFSLMRMSARVAVTFWAVIGISCSKERVKAWLFFVLSIAMFFRILPMRCSRPFPRSSS